MKRKLHWGRITVLILGVILLGAIVFAARIINRFRDKNTSFGDVLSGMRNPRGQFPGQDRLTVLLIGQDYNHDNRGFQSSKNTRADTVMLLAIDLEKKQIRACSIPRDTYVTAPDGKSGKINATYMRGGPELLKKTIQGLFDLKIDNYFVIKADAVRNIVDSLGGVEVETLDAMKYDDNWGGLHINLPAGKQVVDGKGAEGFVRFREVNRFRMNSEGKIIPLAGVKHSKEEGDLRRMARQQQLIESLVHSANSASNIVKADSIIETGFNQIQTDLPRIKCLALANIFKGSNKGSLISGIVPGSDTKKNGVYFYELDPDRAKATVDYILKGDEAAGKRLVRIGIKNGTKVSGVAKSLADKLNEEGYTASSLGNATSSTLTSVVYQKTAFEAIAKHIQRNMGAKMISKMPAVSATRPDIEIVIGEDLAKKILTDSKHTSVPTHAGT